MKKVLNVFIGAIAGVIALTFILAGCSDILNAPDSSLDGRGMVTIYLGGGENARTLLPGKIDYDVYYVVIFVSRDSKESVAQSHTTGQETSVTANLIPGAWTVNIQGFLSEADAGNESKALVTGNKDFNIEAGAETSVTVNLTLNAENLPQGGKGTFAITISLPAGAAGYYEISSTDDRESAFSATYPLPEKTDNLQNRIELPSGSYEAAMIADLKGKEKTWREIIHIYDDIITEAEIEFTAADFTVSSSAKITGFKTGSGNVKALEAFICDENTLALEVIAPGVEIADIHPIITFEGAMITPAPGDAPQFDSNGLATYTVYTESGTPAVYTLRVINKIETADVLKKYLSALPENTMETPYPAIKVDADLSNGGWADILTALQIADRFVELDLSDSDGMKEFNPGSANTGEKMIVSLVLPNTTTAIVNGPSVVNKTSYSLFQHFSSLAAIKGANVETVGDNAFRGYTADKPNAVLKSAEFPALKRLNENNRDIASIGDRAFAYCTALTGLSKLNNRLVLGIGVFEGCDSLIRVTMGSNIVRSASAAKSNPFPGDLFDKYLNNTTSGYGPGTYVRNDSQDMTWTKLP